MTINTRPILTINLKNLAKNYQTLASIIPNSIAAAVVKDDAYGIGAIEVVKKLYNDCNCKNFFVAHAFEGAQIRPYAPSANIYALNGVGQDSIDDCKKAGLIPVISSPEQLSFWQQNKIDSIKPAIQIETGLNRLGFNAEELKTINKEDFSLAISHLACADDKNSEQNKEQLKNFNNLCQEFFTNIPTSISASDGLFLGADFYKDMARLGAGVYGLNNTTSNPQKMLNVMSIKAPVLRVCSLEKGQSIGYGATYQTSQKIKTAIISIGYGDGLFRSLSNTGKVFFNGVAAKILGRVSMDSIVVDISNADVNAGDLATLLADNYTADNMAADAGTIGYEIISRFGKSNRFIKKYL